MSVHAFMTIELDQPDYLYPRTSENCEKSMYKDKGELFQSLLVSQIPAEFHPESATYKILHN